MEITEYENAEFGRVRVVSVDGEPWFVGKDVAQALGYIDHKNALKWHVDAEDKQGWQITTHGSKATIINESGLYSLILSSKMQGAKRFKRWVTSEVLPSIRRHGYYRLQVQDRTPRWCATRQCTKDTHKPFRASINLLSRHHAQLGTKKHPDGFYYGHLTNVVQDFCDIMKGHRDDAPVSNLNKLDQCQQMVANLIPNLITQGKADTFETTEAHILEHFTQLNNLLNGQVLLIGPGGEAQLEPARTPEAQSKEFINKFIDEYCVLDPQASIPRAEFLRNLRSMYPEECKRFTDRTITEAVKQIEGIDYRAGGKYKTYHFYGLGWQ